MSGNGDNNNRGCWAVVVVEGAVAEGRNRKGKNKMLWRVLL